MPKYNASLRKQVEFFASEMSRRTELSLVECRYITKLFYDCSKQFLEETGRISIPLLGAIQLEEVPWGVGWRFRKYCNVGIKKDGDKYKIYKSRGKKTKKE